MEDMQTRLSSIFYALEEIRKFGYIKFKDEGYSLIQFLVKEGVFNASITKDGLDYYYAHILRKSTLRSLKNQTITNVITPIISVVAILGTIGTGIYSTNHNKDRSLQLDSLKREVQQLKDLQHSQVATHKTADTISKKK